MSCAVCCELSVVYRLMYVVFLVGAGAVCCVLLGVRCLLFAVRCELCVVF